MAPAAVHQTPGPVIRPEIIINEKELPQDFLPPVEKKAEVSGSFLRPYQKLGNSLVHVLREAANTQNGIEFHTPDHTNLQTSQISYTQLLSQARADAISLHSLPGLSRDTIFLLHFDNHYDNIRWFWAVTLAGYLPCISTPFVNEPAQREKHILHLKSLLGNPVTLVNGTSSLDFQGMEHLTLYPVESLPPKQQEATFVQNRRSDNTAALMLTSGSTGHAKAVCLSHRQMISAAIGKSQHGGTTSGDVFLGWIGLDHAVSLVETHIQAMLLCATQVLVQARDLLANPLLFLDLIHKHRVSISFAPNFFLDLVRAKVLATDPTLENPKKLDLSSLKGLHSGGEANDVQTIAELTNIFAHYGNTNEFVRAGYGLTESCAGATACLASPSYDRARGLEFASLGRPIPGCNVRIITENGVLANIGEIGDIHMSGPVVFSEYYNNPEATREAFTSGAWFKTGDQGYIDEDGQLNMTGRTKELLIINGFNHYPYQIEQAVEQAQIAGLTPSFTAVFAHRPRGARTESYCLIYCPTFSEDDTQARVETHDAIARVASAITNVQPYEIIPLPHASFNRSSLGKLSRAKLKAAFESGKFEAEISKNQELIHAYRVAHRQAPSTPTEEVVTKVVAEYLSLDPSETSVSSNIIQLGFTSLNFFSLTTILKTQLSLPYAPDLVSLLRDPTISGIASSIDKEFNTTGSALDSYDPVVPLQSQGSSTPIWLVHPVTGSVLPFMTLAQYFPDRPVYGLRSRGVKPGEPFFSSFAEAATAYYNGIKRTQPQGPYAIAGYSMGSSIAFELAKLLEADGDEVRLFASLDCAPHVAGLMGHLTWASGLVMSSFFYNILSERDTKTLMKEVWEAEPEKALDAVIARADPVQLGAMQLDREGLSHVANVMANFVKMCREYEPSGSVKGVDAFVAEPPLMQPVSRSEWTDTQVQGWKDFAREGGVEAYACDGGHHDMLDKKHVGGFQRKLKAVLTKRGL